MALASLVVELSANVARFESDMGKAAHIAERSARQIKYLLGGVLASINFDAAVSAVKQFATETITAAAALDDMSEITGVAVEQLSAMQAVAQVGGHSMEAITGAIVKLNKNISGVGVESKQATTALQGLGLDPEKLRNSENLMLDLAKAFYEFSDKGPGKASYAIALMGKAGAQNLPFLKDLAEQVENLRKVTAEEAAQAEALEKNWKRIGLAASEVKRGLLLDMMPAMERIIGAMREAQKEGGTLYAILVGLGGVLAEGMGLTESAKNAKRLVEIEQQLEVARKQLESGTLAPPGTKKGFFSFLVPDVKLGEEALARIRKTIADLEAERERLTIKPAAKVNKPELTALPEEKVGSEKKTPFEQELDRLRKLTIAREEDNIVAQTAAKISEGFFGQLTKDQERALIQEAGRAEIARQNAQLNKEFQKLNEDASERAVKRILDEDAALTSLAEKYLNMIDPLRKYALELEDIDRLQKAGKLDAEQAAEARFKINIRQFEELEKLNEETKKQTDEITEFWKKAAQEMQSAMSGLFFDVMQGKLSDLSGSIKRTIDRMVADFLAAKAATALLGESFPKEGGAVGGLLGKAIGFFTGGTAGGPSAAPTGWVSGSDLPMGAFALGTDYVPKTGLALVHKGEQIIPANKRGNRSTVINMNINTPDAGSFAASRNQIATSMQLALVSARRNM